MEIIARTGTLDPRQGPGWDDRTFTSFELQTQLSRSPGKSLSIARTGSERGVFVVGGPSGPKMVANSLSVTSQGPQLGPGRRFRSFYSVNGTSEFEFAVGASADGPSSAQVRGHWLIQGSNIYPVAISGQQTNDQGCPFVSATEEPRVAIADQLVLGLHSCSSGPALLVSSPDAISIAAKDGTDNEQGPNLGIGTTFLLNEGSSGIPRLVPMNGPFAYYFAGTSTGLTGIWRIDASGNNPVVVSSLGAQFGPTNLPALTFLGFDGSRIAARFTTDLMFRAILQGPGVTAANRTVIVIHSQLSNQAVARTATLGELGPQIDSSAQFASLESAYSLGDPRQIAFSGTLSGNAQDSGIWIDTGDARRVVARTLTDGQLGPQLGAGVHFQSFGGFSQLRGGDVIAYALLEGSGIDVSNWFGVWRLSTAAAPTLLLRAGQAIDVDPDPGVSFRIIQDIQSPLFGSGQVTSVQLDDAGFVLFRLIFGGAEQALVRIRAGDQLFASGME